MVCHRNGGRASNNIAMIALRMRDACTDHSTGGVSKTTALSGSDFINFQPAAADYGDPLLLLAHSRGHPRPRGASIVALSLVISHGKRGLWYVFGR